MAETAWDIPILPTFQNFIFKRFELHKYGCKMALHNFLRVYISSIRLHYVFTCLVFENVYAQAHVSIIVPHHVKHDYTAE